MECKKCGKCCKDLILPIGRTISDDVKKWLEYHDIEVITGNPISNIKIKNKCSYLVENKCSIYDNRPDVCKEFYCKSNI